MLTGVRVEKHPDHRDTTQFRLLLDGELINTISVDDCLADELECLLTPPDWTDPLTAEEWEWFEFLASTLDADEIAIVEKLYERLGNAREKIEWWKAKAHRAEAVNAVPSVMTIPTSEEEQCGG